MWVGFAKYHKSLPPKEKTSGTPSRSDVLGSRDDEKVFVGYSLARLITLQQNQIIMNYKTFAWGQSKEKHRRSAGAFRFMASP